MSKRINPRKRKKDLGIPRTVPEIPANHMREVKKLIPGKLYMVEIISPEPWRDDEVVYLWKTPRSRASYDESSKNPDCLGTLTNLEIVMFVETAGFQFHKVGIRDIFGYLDGVDVRFYEINLAQALENPETPLVPIYGGDENESLEKDKDNS